MPKKLDDCVQKLIAEGVEEPKAWAICQAAMNDSKCKRGYAVGDSAVENIEKFIDPVTGFMHVKGVIARSGIQKYYGMELPFEGLDPMTIYNVLRPREEVSDAESVRSFINAPVTDEHPDQLVTSENYKNYAKGSVSVIELIEEEEVLLNTDFTIYDAGLTQKAQSGKVKISAGYLCDYVEEAGEYKGVPYQFKQVKIRGNHVAIVDSPRCGDTCKMAVDSGATITDENTINGGIMKKIVINGVEYEVPEEVAAEFERLMAEENMEGEGSNGPASTGSENGDEMEKLKAECDMLKSKLASQSNDSEKIAAAVAERAELIGTAKSIGVEVLATDSATAIKAKVLKEKRGMDTVDKSEAYISAAFDMLMSDKAAATASHKKIADDVKTKTQASANDKWEEIKGQEY